MGQIAVAGNKGKGVRSDCFISMELTSQGGVNIELTSKVKALYSKQIETEIKEILSFFGIEHARVTMEDSGAIPLVIAARMEACIKQLIKTEKEYLLPFMEYNRYNTTKDRNRFSRLYLPGNTPSLAINAGIHHPEGIILDLEDAVAYDRKFEARLLVRNMLRGINFYGAERMVRINQIPAGLEDLHYILPHHINLILVPKCENAQQIHLLNEHIQVLKKEHRIEHEIWLMPIIESALGVMNSFEIATSAPNVVAMAIGLEDYTADLGVKRTYEGSESLFARSMLVNACKAAGIQAIDSVFSDVSDVEALKENVLRSKALGFDGMGCIHPRQIRVIQEHFAPDRDEIEKAKKIIHAFAVATEKGLGVVSLGSKMIDPPVVKRAERIIQLALSTGKLDENWMEEFLQNKNN